MAQKIIGFKITVQGSEAILSSLNQINEQLQVTNKRFKEAEIGSDAYKEVSSELAQLKQAQKSANDEIRQQQKLFEFLKSVPGSYDATRNETSVLRSELNKLGDSIPDEDFADLQRRLESIVPELKELTTAEDGLAKAKTLLSDKIRYNNIKLSDFNRDLAASDELVGEYSRGIINAFGKLGLTAPLETTLTNLNNQYKQGQDELREMVRKYEELKVAGSTALDPALQDIAAMNANLDKLGTEIAQTNRALQSAQAQQGQQPAQSSLAPALAGVGGFIAANFAVDGLSEGIALLKSYTDAQADVAKTTGLTAEQVTRLGEKLKEIDTRTSIEDLLKIAQIGGQFGVQGEAGVEKFTKAVDILNVALGDEFGNGAEQVTTEIGKLSNVLFGVTSDGEKFAENILSLGNALNFLSAEGAATAPAITDLASRFGGIATSFGLTQGEILGLSSTLIELGLTAERGAGGLERIFAGITTKPEEFSKSLGLPLKEFTNLVNNDLQGALVMVVNRVKELGIENTTTAKTLADLEINGLGEKEVFLKLAGAQELLGKRTNQSTEELKRQASLAEEFKKKNENLAATLDKVKKEFIGVVTEPEFLEFVEAAASWLLRLGKAFGGLMGFLINNRDILLSLTSVYVAFNSATIASAIAARGVTIALSAQTIAQRALNVAMNASPIGRAITAISVLIGVIITLLKRSEDARAGIVGFLAAAKQSFISLAQIGQQYLGSLGNVIIGVFTFDLDRIKKGFTDFYGAVKNGVGNVASAFNDGFKNEISEDNLGKALSGSLLGSFAGVEESASQAGSATGDAYAQSIIEAANKKINETNIALPNVAPSDIGGETQSLSGSFEGAGIDPFSDLSGDEAQPGSIAYAEKKLQELQDQLSKATSEDRRLKLRLEIQSAQGEIDTLKGGGGSAKGLLDEVFADLELEFARAELAAKERLSQGLIDEKEYERLITEAKLTALNDRATLLEQGSLEYINIQKQILDAELANVQETEAKKREETKKTFEATKAIEEAKLSLSGDVIKGLQGLLAQDTENRKKYGVAIKALALAEIAINLQKELSAIAANAAANPANAVTAGIVGITQFTIQKAAAVIRATFAAAQVLAQKFQFGGRIYGPSHNQGGVPIEAEGGEGMINKNSMASKDVYSVTGTPVQIASAINRVGGGVSFASPPISFKKFEFGGLVPLAAPTFTRSNPVFTGTPDSDSGQQLNLILKYIAETNARIDRIQVYNNATDTVKTADRVNVFNQVGTL